MRILVLLSMCIVPYVLISLFWNPMTYVVSKKGDFDTSSSQSYFSERDIFKKEWVTNVENSPREAYQEFKVVYNSAPVEKKHFYAHVFGELLFEIVGLEGLAICDHEYSYGCLHELISEALMSYGLGVLPEIDIYCKSKYDCQHGVGHGLLGYYGYEYSNLVEALSVCHTIGSVDSQDGCYGGIFMEYNLRSMLAGKGGTKRIEENEEKLDALCTLVPPYAKEACYFWYPQWLMDGEDKNNLSIIYDTGDRCTRITDVTDEARCFIGLGYELTTHTQNIGLLREYCESFSDQKSYYGETYCKAGAAASLFTQSTQSATVEDMCDGLKGEQADFCLLYSSWSDGKRVVPKIFTQ